MKKCKQGYYFCTKEKKCMPIPSGYRIGYGGWLTPKNGKNGKNGNGNGNGSSNGHTNGSNGNGNGNGGNGNGGNGGGGVSEEVKRLNIEIPKTPTEFKLGLMFRESLDYNSGMLFVFEEVGQKSFHMKDTRIPLDIAFIKEDGTIESIKQLEPFTLLPVSSDGDVLSALEVNRGWFAENNIKVGDKIRNPLNEDVDILDAKGNLYATVIDIIKPEPMMVPKPTVQWEDPLEESTYLPKMTGNIINVYLAWRGRTQSVKMFFPSVRQPSRKEVMDQLQKVYPGAKLWSYQIDEYDPNEPLIHTSS
tara:strand:- start:164 stop:1075 length:912 start_codon:yes stop_codon:yes gene_type:complete